MMQTIRAAIEGLIAAPRLEGAPPGGSKQSSDVESPLPIDPSAIQRIRDQFVDELSAKMDDMETNFAAGDWDRLMDLAHGLKGSGGTVGVGCVTQPAGELEQHASQRNAKAARRALNDLWALVDRITLAAV